MRVKPVGARTRGIGTGRPSIVAQDAWPEGGAGEGVAVGGEGALVLRPAVDVVEHTPGQAPPSDAPEVGHTRRPCEASLDAVPVQGAEPEHGPDTFQHLGNDLTKDPAEEADKSNGKSVNLTVDHDGNQRQETLTDQSQ
jgi:hypothetical protein